MFSSIMVPVDLAHADSLEKALKAAADLSNFYHASVCIVGVTASAPSAVAHNTEEYAEKLDAFAAAQGEKHGVTYKAKAMVTADPAVDLGKTLETAAEDLNADLIVMASHVPGFADHIIASNAGHMAAHAKSSVLVVR